MAKVALYLRTHNNENHIEEAIVSLLGQTGVQFEILIVDDGSDDNTLEIINSFQDQRIRVIKDQKNMGHSFYKSLLIKEISSPFMVFTEPDYILLPDAIKRLFHKITSSDNIGLVYCYHFTICEKGTITRETFHKLFKRMRREVRIDMDYRNEILYKGLEINGLRIYRKEIFNSVEMFDETIKHNQNYEFSLRILDKYEVALLPEFLFYVRKKKNYVNFNRIKSIMDLPNKLSINRKLLSSNKALYLNQKKYKPYRIVLNCICKALSFSETVEVLNDLFMKVLWSANRKVLIPLFSKIYNLLITHFSWWSIDLFTHKKGRYTTNHKRIAYFLWQFPVISQTFVQREVAALINAGHSVKVISEMEAEDGFLEEYADSLINSTLYLSPTDKKKLATYKKYFFFKNPLIYLSLFFYVLFHRYHGGKSFTSDGEIFLKAIYLSGILKENNINHVHSPWADNCALISLIASRFLGISYSLQARAHDIHRKAYLVGLQERFNGAEFIITNTQYNVCHINSLLNHHRKGKINLIYNGVDLDKLRPGKEKEKLTHPLKILSVARLIDQKGLVYLLKACEVLKDNGYRFQCEIIGGTEDVFMNYYLELKKLRKMLELTNRINLLGSQPFWKILEAYRSADIFVLPCVIAEDGSRDITPNSLIEAMAMRLPVISTNVTGIPEIVENGVSGILVPPKDEIALSQAMMELIENDDLRKTLGKNARKRVEERFDINKNVIKYVALFNGTG